MAPEILNGRVSLSQMSKSDIYSFGCIIYLLSLFSTSNNFYRYFKKNVFRGKYKTILNQNAQNEIPFATLNTLSFNTAESLKLNLIFF